LAFLSRGTGILCKDCKSVGKRDDCLPLHSRHGLQIFLEFVHFDLPRALLVGLLGDQAVVSRHRLILQIAPQESVRPSNGGMCLEH
jgi:hypothetical protein